VQVVDHNLDQDFHTYNQRVHLLAAEAVVAMNFVLVD
jgi:hypothetical protein